MSNESTARPVVEPTTSTGESSVYGARRIKRTTRSDAERIIRSRCTLKKHAGHHFHYQPPTSVRPQLRARNG